MIIDADSHIRDSYIQQPKYRS